MERITKKKLDRQMELLCENLGVPNAHYERVEDGKGDCGHNNGLKKLSSGLVLSSLNGLGHGHKYKVENGNGGDPMGSYRLTASEMFHVLYAINNLFNHNVLKVGE